MEGVTWLVFHKTVREWYLFAKKQINKTIVRNTNSLFIELGQKHFNQIPFDESLIFTMDENKRENKKIPNRSFEFL